MTKAHRAIEIAQDGNSEAQARGKVKVLPQLSLFISLSRSFFLFLFCQSIRVVAATAFMFVPYIYLCRLWRCFSIIHYTHTNGTRLKRDVRCAGLRSITLSQYSADIYLADVAVVGGTSVVVVVVAVVVVFGHKNLATNEINSKLV